MKKILTLFLVLACAWIASGGPLDSGLPVGPSSAGGGTKFPLSPPLTVTPTSAEIATPGYSLALTATSPSSGAISYSSSDTDIATVSAAGVVTFGNTTGTANITVIQAAVGSYFSAAQVTVPVVASWNYLPWDAYDVAVYFDNSDDLASGSATGFPSGGSARTFMWWELDQDTADAGFAVTMCYGELANYKGFFTGYWDLAAHLLAFYNSGYNYTASRSSSEWMHHALVMPENGTIASISYYINGIEVTSKTIKQGSASDLYNTTVNAANSSFYIGDDPRQGGSKWSGKMAEIAIFNRALSSGEVAFYKPYRLKGTEDGLIRLFHCDDGSGATITDSVGGYHLTLTSGATWTTKL